MKTVLVAAIGNIFYGDDGFGCEVASELAHMDLPDEVSVIDFGIRSYDLTYALADSYDLIILIDAVPQKKEPGTVFLIEPDLGHLDEFGPIAVDPHSMNPVSVLKMAQSVGRIKGKLYLVGCEPAALENDSGEITLSEPVRQAVPQAAQMVKSLVEEFLATNRRTTETVSH